MVQAIMSVKHFEIGAILLTGITNSVDYQCNNNNNKNDDESDHIKLYCKILLIGLCVCAILQ